MIRKLSNAILQDLLLTFRSGHIYVILALAAVMLILVFALPAEVNTQAQEYFYDASEAQIFTRYLAAAEAPDENVVPSEAEMQAVLAESQKALGVIFRGSLEAPEFEIIVQGNISEQNINLLKKSLDTIIQGMQGTLEPVDAQTTVLTPGSQAIPLNKNMIPIFMSFEVILLGFMIGAVLIFQSKQEGTIRAYRVSPGGTLVFILSKVILYDGISLIYGLVIALIAFGTTPNYLYLVLLILAGSTLDCRFLHQNLRVVLRGGAAAGGGHAAHLLLCHAHFHARVHHLDSHLSDHLWLPGHPFWPGQSQCPQPDLPDPVCWING
jgi:ABC-2 type transport system permease protein/fluoroquinolone transport system permease protein